MGYDRSLVFETFLAGRADELIAGLLAMIGWQVCGVASLLAVFLLVDAFISHPFWALR